jgi:zinc protease
MENGKRKIENLIKTLLVCCLFVNSVAAQQETPPAPQAPKSVNIPAVKESKLPNGLTIAVVERKNVPIVSVQLLVKNGAERELADREGLANLTASLLTKGTKTRTASQIAEEIEFLGGSINTGAGSLNSVVSVNVMSDKLDQAVAILSDVVLNPKFEQNEIDLLKSQTLDGLTYNLTQPGFLASYVASVYSYDEHPAGGTPESIKAITKDDITEYHRNNYQPNDSVLIFTGDITHTKANELAQKFFGKWRKNPRELRKTSQITVKNFAEAAKSQKDSNDSALFSRILVIDLPKSGQAAVNYLKRTGDGRISTDANNKVTIKNGFYPASVLNSVLGGGYSSRLNQEIRIKRGLSYGAGSSFAWRSDASNFATRTQTKNESAAEVAELVLAEVKRLTEGAIADVELTPRKSVLIGNFGRNLETTEGLAAAVADLYTFGLPTSELNFYTKNVEAVKDAEIREFAKANLLGGDIIIVGDYSVFKDDLAKRFPNMTIDVIKAAELDLSKENLRK